MPADIPAEDPPPPTFRDSQPYFPPESRESNHPPPQTSDPPKRNSGGGVFFLIVSAALVYYVIRWVFGGTLPSKCYLCRSRFWSIFKGWHHRHRWKLRDGSIVHVCSACNRCQICEVSFGGQDQLQEWQFEDGRKVICSHCHKKLARKVRSEKFDEWFDETFEPKTEEPTTPKTTRERIPSAVRREVWRRDQGKCVECGINENIEYDHIIPVSKGGANTVRNLQLLCEDCNRSKSANIQ